MRNLKYDEFITACDIVDQGLASCVSALTYVEFFALRTHPFFPEVDWFQEVVFNEEVEMRHDGKGFNSLKIVVLEILPE